MSSAAALAAALPPGRVSAADADLLAVSADLWPRHLIRLAHGEQVALPDAVVWPESTGELAAVVRVARERGFSLVAYGAGSSVVGGATPRADQVVVDFKRMARILEVDAAAKTATAQVGILGELFERQLGRRGLTQGHFPSSIYCSTLGGWIAARSAGQMSSRYGKIEDQVVGGVVVRGDGQVLRQLPSVVRDPAFDALVGAEGTLALWSEATVRVHPVPQRRAWRGVVFPSLDAAVEVVRGWLDAGISPAVVRIYDALDTWLHRLSHGEHRPGDRGPSRLAWLGANMPRLTSRLGDLLAGGLLCIAGVQGNQRQVDAEMSLIVERTRRAGGRDLGAEAGEAWYRRRYAVSYGQSRAYRGGVAVDTMEVACTWDRLAPTYRAVRRAAHAARAQVLAHFSHVYLEGASIYFTYAMPLRRGVEGYDRLWRDALSAASRAGANVSHHHGTGRLKAGALATALGGGRDAWQHLRKEIDPDAVLNPEILTGHAGADARPPRTGVPEAATATVGEGIGEVEKRSAAAGMTLGPVAELLPHLAIGEAARRGCLWRYDSQVRVIESLLLGVDGEIDGRAHRFTPAPRAAMGPNLLSALLAGEVERLWLRPVRRRTRCFRVPAPTDTLLRGMAAAAADEAAGAAWLSATVSRDEGVIRGWLPDGSRGDLARDAVEAILGPLGPPGEAPEPVLSSVAGPHSGEPLLVAGRWAAIRGLCAALDEGVRVTFFAVDALGAAGLVHAEALDAEARGRLVECARELGAIPGAQLEEPRRLASGSSGGVAPWEGETPRAPLALPGRRGALDNCTYCPKLCRFACPVAVADGNEALLPRQLMLAVNLHRKGVRQLSADVAGRLWSCVDCQSCRTFCDHDNDVASVLVEARAAWFAAGGGPPSVRSYLAGFSSGRPPDRPPHDDVVAALEGDGPSAATWLFLGCQGSRGDLEPARAALALARRRFGAVHVMDGVVRCCGAPLWRWGDHVGFARHARAFGVTVGDARRLVVDDPGCAYTLDTLYRQAGVSLPEVVTTTALLREETWRPARVAKWAVHDDAWALRWLKEPSLATMPGLADLTLPPGSVTAGEAGSCGGMLLSVYDPAVAKRVARHCVGDLLGGGARRILVASPTCRRRLRAVGAAVDDVLQLWHESN